LQKNAQLNIESKYLCRKLVTFDQPLSIKARDINCDEKSKFIKNHGWVKKYLTSSFTYVIHGLRWIYNERK